MQAILTKYLAPTDYRGGRVKAQGNRTSVTVSWNHALSVPENHRVAAKAYAEKMGWTPDQAACFSANWCEGSMPEASPWSYCYVLPEVETPHALAGFRFDL